jgi:hypothetical protein
MVVTLQVEAVQQARSDNSFADAMFDNWGPEALIINICLMDAGSGSSR